MLNFLILTWVTAYSFSGEFSRGSNFNFRFLEGEIEVQCPNLKTVTFCRDQFLEPWPYDYFIGPKIPESNKILFEVSAPASQEIRTLEAIYYGHLGRSEEVNLGISSLFQRPLLKIGENKIIYKLFNRSRKILFEGNFLVKVGRASTMICDSQKIDTKNSEDCELSYTICQQYFNELNYCRR